MVLVAGSMLALPWAQGRLVLGEEVVVMFLLLYVVLLEVRAAGVPILIWREEAVPRAVVVAVRQSHPRRSRIASRYSTIHATSASAKNDNVPSGVPEHNSLYWTEEPYDTETGDENGQNELVCFQFNIL